MAPLYTGADWVPLNPPLPTVPLPPEECCTAEDPAIGRCMHPAGTPHDIHRVTWNQGANVGTWRTTRTPPFVHPI